MPAPARGPQQPLGLPSPVGAPAGGAYPGGTGGVRVLEERPDAGLQPPPAPALALGGRPYVLDAQSLGGQVVVAVVGGRLARQQVGCLEDVEGLLGVAVLAVGHPAARLHVGLVDAPEGQLLLEERPADVGGAVQLAGAVVVENIGEDPRVPVEEELAGAAAAPGAAAAAGLRAAARRRRRRVGGRRRLLAARGLALGLAGEQSQAGPRQGLQGAAVGLVPRAPHVEDHPLVVLELPHRSGWDMTGESTGGGGGDAEGGAPVAGRGAAGRRQVRGGRASALNANRRNRGEAPQAAP